jgi:hypothetical protein
MVVDATALATASFVTEVAKEDPAVNETSNPAGAVMVTVSVAPVKALAEKVKLVSPDAVP